MEKPSDLLGYKLKEKETGHFWWVYSVYTDSIFAINPEKNLDNCILFTELLKDFDLVEAPVRKKVECYMLDGRPFVKASMRDTLLEVSNSEFVGN